MPQPRISQQAHSFGFTLAELLISLAILGVIATFTIPKILSTQQNTGKNAKAKEAIAMISEAYSTYMKNNTVTSNVSGIHITQYMNYVNRQSTNIGALTCGAAVCLRLHNGGALRPRNCLFGGLNTTNANQFTFIPDPDGDPADVLNVFLYVNGRVTTSTGIQSNTCDSCSCSNPSADPTWFNW